MSMEKQSLNIWHAAATVLMLITLAAHVFAGGPENYTPLRNSPMDAIPKATLSVVWHMITLVLLMFTGALGVLSRCQNSPLFTFVMIGNLGFAGLFLAYGIADFASIWPLPQWIAFVATAALMALGRRTM